MPSITHESASGSTGTTGVLAALNSNRSANKEAPEVDFLSILRENASGIAGDNRAEASVQTDNAESNKSAQAHVGAHVPEDGRREALDELQQNSESVDELSTDSKADAGMNVDVPDVDEVEVVVETENAADSDVEDLLEEMMDMTGVANDEMNESAGVEEIVALEADVATEDALAEAAEALSTETAEDAVIDEEPVTASVEADDEYVVDGASEDAVPAVNQEQMIPEATDMVENEAEEVSADVAGNDTEMQAAVAMAEESIPTTTEASQGAEAELADAHTKGAETVDEAIQIEAASHGPDVAQENVGKSADASVPQAETAAPAIQGEAAVANRIAAREAQAESGNDEATPATDSQSTTMTPEATSDPIELRREFARIRMHTGVGEVERKVVQGGRETATEAVAGTFRSQAAEAAEAKEGVAETGRQTMNTTRFVEDIISQARMLSKPDGSTEMRLRLDPPELGSVLVRLTLNDNKLDVQLEVDSPAVRQMVGDTLQRVREILSDDGVDLENLDIGLRRQPNQGAGENGRQGSPRRGGDDDSDATDEAQVVNPRADALRRAMLSAAGMIDFTA